MGQTNIFNKKEKKLSLQGYYDALPEPTNPKREFILEVMTKCKVVETTVFNWIAGRSKASDQNIQILSQITGIAPEDLWKE